MALTLTNWIIVVVIFVCGIGVSIYRAYDKYEVKSGVIGTLITAVIVVIIALCISWWHNNTASGARAYKDYESNMSNGIERNLQVIADDGMIIYEHEGKFDIEVHDTYIVFDENNTRTILYRSYTSTLVIEKIGS